MRGGMDAPQRRIMDPKDAARLVRDVASRSPDLGVTLAGAGDPLLHPRWREVVDRARESGAAGVHVRTDLVGGVAEADALLAGGVDVVSIDLLADTPETYRRLMGVDAHAQVVRGIERLLEGRSRDGGLPALWVVPRMTRCDAVYQELERFYDTWIMRCGAAVIDPLPRVGSGDRIEPLPLSPPARRIRDATQMLVLSDGRVPEDERDLLGETWVGSIHEVGAMELWRRLTHARAHRAAHGAGSVVRAGAA